MGLSTIKTEENIFRAYKRECRDKATYRAFAGKAEAEGNMPIAALFRAMADSEDVHAHALLRALRETSPTSTDMWEAELYDPEGLKASTEQNVRTAIEGENDECSTLYPQMIADAEKDGWTFARDCFSMVNSVEKIHLDLLKEAQEGRQVPMPYAVCEVCGNTVQRKPILPCEVCSAPGSSFHTVH